MSSVEKNLTQGEELIYEAHVSWAVYVRPLILLAIVIWLSSKIHGFVVFLAVIFSLIIVFRIFLAIVTTEFALTSRRIMAKKGVLKKQSMEILLNKVESIKIQQPLDGRIFGFGTVIVVGSGGSEEYFHSINHPQELQRHVNQQISKLSNSQYAR
jgi:uncharacterized membrane protein YdbT with pleckstrin-like domain